MKVVVALGRGINVLIVEDSFFSADINARMLTRAGYQVEWSIVSNPKEMAEALEEKKWDLILSDNSMPEFSALDALQLRNSTSKCIPFVIVSEQISDEEIISASKNGANGFVFKGEMWKLKETVRQIFSD